MMNQMHATNNRIRRNVNEMSTGGNLNEGSRGGHGRGGRGGSRYGNRSGRSNGRTCTDSKMITLTDGKRIEYHASFNFPCHVYMKMI